MTRLVLLLLVFTLHGCTIERAGQEAPPDTTDSVIASSETTYRIDSVIVPSPARPPSPGRTGGAARLLPVDEADEAPDFHAYRRRLIEAVSARDTSALYAMMSEDVHVSFGGNRGRADFREMWRPERENSQVWRILGRVLGGGGMDPHRAVRPAIRIRPYRIDRESPRLQSRFSPYRRAVVDDGVRGRRLGRPFAFLVRDGGRPSSFLLGEGNRPFYDERATSVSSGRHRIRMGTTLKPIPRLT